VFCESYSLIERPEAARFDRLRLIGGTEIPCNERVLVDTRRDLGTVVSSSICMSRYKGKAKDRLSGITGKALRRKWRSVRSFNTSFICE